MPKRKIIKYINKKSIHTKATLKAIPSSILKWLEMLTSKIEYEYKMRVKECYTGHNWAINKAGCNLTREHLGEMPTSRRKRKKKKHRRKEILIHNDFLYGIFTGLVGENP